MKMPKIGFGTFLMNGTECEESVSSAINVGYRLIDTAEAYGNEVSVGRGIAKSSIAREEIYIVTKINFRSYENARRSVENSLKNLQTDYLDLVLLHWPFRNYYAAWKELEKLYKEGIVHAIGVSNFTPDRLIDLIEFNEIAPSVNQIETNLLCQRHFEHEWMNKYHIQHMGYAPLCQGRKNDMFQNPALLKIAETHAKTPAQVALRFLLQNDVIAIPKSVHIERIKENFDIFDFTLSSDEMNILVKMNTGVPLIGNPENPALVEAAMKW